jgi:hypothetical protein
MGTQGKKNTPITARVNAGLFNQKKGITEPLLGVGPAGVYGNNQTKDIPSPSKMRGYAKRSPLKQEKLKDPVVTKATKTDIEVIDPTITKGKPGTENLDKLNKGKKDLGPDYKPPAAETARANAEVAKAKAKDLKGAKDVSTCPDGSTLVNGKCQKIKKTDTPKTSLTKDAEDTQTARERSNTVRGGKRMNKKERQAQKKIDRLNRKSGAIDPSTIKKDKEGNDIKDSGTKYDRKKQKTARLMKEAKDKRALASASSDGAQRQAEQNRSISARKTGTMKSNSRVVDTSDQSSANVTKNANESANGGPNATSTTAKPTPTSSGVTNEELAGTDKVKSPSPKKKGFGMKKPLYK